MSAKMNDYLDDQYGEADDIAKEDRGRFEVIIIDGEVYIVEKE